jgi:hypothetical protein
MGDISSPVNGRDRVTWGSFVAGRFGIKKNINENFRSVFSRHFSMVWFGCEGVSWKKPDFNNVFFCGLMFFRECSGRVIITFVHLKTGGAARPLGRPIAFRFLREERKSELAHPSRGALFITRPFQSSTGCSED